MTNAEPAYLLDTITTMTLMRADAPPGLRARVRGARLGSLWMSALTEARLRQCVGAQPTSSARLEALNLLFRNVPTLPFDRAAAVAYADLRGCKSTSTELTELELMIAAHAISVEAILVTSHPSLHSIDGLHTTDWLSD